MIARGNLVAEMIRLGSHQPFHSQHFFRGNHFVGIAGKKIHRQPQAREVDLLSQRDEASGGEFVALV